MNVRSQNTRVVRRDGATSQPTPQPTPWQQEAPAPPAGAAADDAAVVGRRAARTWMPMDDACRALDAAPARGQILLSHLRGGTCSVDLAR